MSVKDSHLNDVLWVLGSPGRRRRRGSPHAASMAVTTDEHAPPPFLPQVFTVEAASSFLSLIFHSTTRSKQTISSLLYVDEEK